MMRLAIQLGAVPVPFDLEKFARLRPYLFHLTDEGNIPRIRELKTLEPTSRILEQAARPELVRQRRSEHVRVAVSAHHISVRDQKPLYSGNIWYEGGWQFEDLVEFLNQHVFFWPGTSQGPATPSGVRYMKRYESEQPAILRIGFQSLTAANRNLVPLFCRFNSGAPRCNEHSPNPGGKASRGPHTFLPAHDFGWPPSEVVEVVFRSSVTLPKDSEVKWHRSGQWEPLF